MSNNKKPPAKLKPITVERKYYDNPSDMENAKLIQALQPRMALEAFRTNKAKDCDWLMLQYWLYYAEALVSLFTTETPEQRTLLGAVVGESIQALYMVGRRYNASGFVVMTATESEIAFITEGLSIMDGYKDATDERTLLVIGKHVERVLQAK